MLIIPRKSLNFSGAVLAVCLSGSVDAQFSSDTIGEVSFSGTLELQLAISSEDGATQKFQSTFEPRMELKLSDNVRLTAIGRVRADAETDLGFAGSNARTDVEIREFYLDADWAGSYWRLGKQQVVWGQADGLRVLDVINPLEYREFILPEFEDNRIPLWMANVEIPLNDDWAAQLLVIPDQTYDDLPQSDSAFAMRSSQVIPEIPPGLPVELGREARPRRTFKDADAGVRLSAFLGGWDISLNYLYHYQDQEVLYQEVTELGINITPTFERTHLLGGSFSNVFGDTTFRSEAGYSSDRYFLTNNPTDEDGVFSTAEFSYVLGVD